MGPGDLDQAAITEFRDALRAAGMRWVPGAHGLDPLLEYLEGQGVLGGSSSSAARRAPSSNAVVIMAR